MVSLNPAQHAAVEHQHGPLLVLAGAGSGKTRVITHRIARLVERGVRPSSILAVSFTNKAAAELSERMRPLVGNNTTSKLWLSTFHSFGVRFLQRENRALGFDGRFVIFDQADSIGLLREIIKREGLGDRSIDLNAVQARISLWKNAFMMPEQVPESDYEYDDIAREAYGHYREALLNMHAVDFDDLVVAPVQILKKNEAIREKWRAHFQYLLIDEFQDSNISQLELIKELANERHNVCVVGDDDQSIYGWRGAEVGNILRFEKHFPGATIVKLEENYRSKEPIIALANAAIEQSKGIRHDKSLIATRGEGELVKMVAAIDAGAEAKFIGREIRRLTREQGLKYGQIAVLYRSNMQAQLVEETFQVEGIPYRLFGGTKFFDRKEVKDAIAYLRLLIHPRDDLSLRRVINFPPRGIGDTSVRRITAFATRNDITFGEALRSVEQVGLNERTVRSVKEFVFALDEARAEFFAGDNIFEATKWLMERVGIAEYLQGDKTKQGERRRANHSHFMKTVERYQKRNDTAKPSLEQFLMQLTLERDSNDEEEDVSQVTMSSLHSSKGLEFDVVFLIGVVEGTLPHSRTTDPKALEASPTDVEEERRLFYVGVTRARDVLYISRPERRMMRGVVRPLAPSRFLEGLPEDKWEVYESRLSAEPEVAKEEAADFASAILAQLRGE